MWLRWAVRRGVSPTAILAVAHGRRTLETMQLVAPQFATPEEAAELDAEEEEEAREHGGETAVAGAALLLSALPITRWAIVTSADADIARRRVAGVGLPVPRLLIGAGDVQRRKAGSRRIPACRPGARFRARAMRGRGGHTARRAGRPRGRCQGDRDADDLCGARRLRRARSGSAVHSRRSAERSGVLQLQIADGAPPPGLSAAPRLVRAQHAAPMRCQQVPADASTPSGGRGTHGHRPDALRERRRHGRRAADTPSLQHVVLVRHRRSQGMSLAVPVLLCHGGGYAACARRRFRRRQRERRLACAASPSARAMTSATGAWNHSLPSGPTTWARARLTGPCFATTASEGGGPARGVTSSDRPDERDGRDYGGGTDGEKQSVSAHAER